MERRRGGMPGTEIVDAAIAAHMQILVEQSHCVILRRRVFPNRIFQLSLSQNRQEVDAGSR